MAVINFNGANEGTIPPINAMAKIEYQLVWYSNWKKIEWDGESETDKNRVTG